MNENFCSMTGRVGGLIQWAFEEVGQQSEICFNRAVNLLILVTVRKISNMISN